MDSVILITIWCYNGLGYYYNYTRIFHIRRVPASVFSWVLFSVTRRYKFWNVCVLEIGDILFTLSYIYNFFCGLFILLFIFFWCIVDHSRFQVGSGEISVRGRYSLNWSWWGAFQLLPSYWWLMLLPGSRGVLGGGSKVFLWHIPLRRAVPCLGPFEGSRSGSKIVLSGVGQTFSVRRVIYIQWYELSIRVDG